MKVFFSPALKAAAFAVGILFWAAAPCGSAEAFEKFLPESPILKCQTACHKAENIAHAHRDKSVAAECRDCHAAPSAASARSPFRPPGKMRLINAGSSPQFLESIYKGFISAPPPGNRKSKNPSPAKKKKSKGPQKYPKMVLVPAGEFIMGSNERWDDEAPEFIASTGAFYIDLYEVTNEDYKKFVDAAKRTPPYHWPGGKIPRGKEKHPVVYVNWFDARDYCQWAGKRLPTEEEWEKAARGEDGNIYPWGNVWTLDKSNNPYKHSTGTEPVGSYPEGRSPYGLYDMSGNVWEWVDSFYLPHPGNIVQRAEYGRDKRVLKGGSWFDCLSYGCGLSAPTFNRSFFTPEVRNNSFGFRCAKSP
ncbi:MAG: formylglycine-generating enzyme family protein [Nitrospinaceae bacterium]